MGVGPALQQIGLCPAAFRTPEPIRPTPFRQKERATRFVGKPTLEIEKGGVFPGHATGLCRDRSPYTSETWDNGISHRDLTDFNRTQVAVIVDTSDFLGTNDVDTLLKFQWDKNTLTFSDLLKTFFASQTAMIMTSVDVHFGGPEKAVRILGMAGAAAKFPDLVESWTNEDESVAVAMEMENRAIGFDADELIPARPFGAETTLRTALVHLIGAAVSGDTPAASPHLTKPLTILDLGRLAAIALRGDLVFEKPPDVQVAYTKAAANTAADPLSVPAASATVFASIHQPKLFPSIEDVEFRFRRESGNPQWKLIGFGAAAKSQE